MTGTRAERTAITTKPDYGIDAPGVVRNLYLVFAAGIGAFATSWFGLWSGVAFHVDFAHAGLFAGLGCGLMGTWMLYDSLVGKVRERERLLDLVELRATDHVLDVGCGRGLLLIGAARRLTTGRAVGLDLWSSVDLTGNTASATLENARREGVADRVHVETGDMRQMPFADATFDVVVSNAAIHNIGDREGRVTAMREIGRVLKAGGRLVIHDIRHVDQYAAELTKLGFAQVTRRGSAALRWSIPAVDRSFRGRLVDFSAAFAPLLRGDSRSASAAFANITANPDHGPLSLALVAVLLGACGNQRASASFSRAAVGRLGFEAFHADAADLGGNVPSLAAIPAQVGARWRAQPELRELFADVPAGDSGDLAAWRKGLELLWNAGGERLLRDALLALDDSQSERAK